MEVISEEDKTEKEKRHRITEVVQNHQFAKAAKMATEALTEEKETELDEEAAKKKLKNTGTTRLCNFQVVY